VADHVAGAPEGLAYVASDPATLPITAAGAVILALPNGKAADYVAAIDARAAGSTVVDLSADYRFDDDWHYGLPELGGRVRGARRISNPGCYATAMQLAIAPLVGLLDGSVQCFGVSGYSGAGTAPSPKNDPACLRDNLMPYSLTGHVHEREVTRHIGHAVEFMPHVAPHFRGLTITANLHLASPMTPGQVRERYAAHYADEPLVRVVDDAPWVSRIAGRHDAEIGGFTLSADGRRLVVVATLDNLLKGAATQALQNLNLAFGLDELAGIPHGPARGTIA
jgi:N-acetyl-gamma-glutamyl-phosphate reductase common form